VDPLEEWLRGVFIWVDDVSVHPPDETQDSKERQGNARGYCRNKQHCHFFFTDVYIPGEPMAVLAVSQETEESHRGDQCHHQPIDQE
jgi:hypothetical protein